MAIIKKAAPAKAITKVKKPAPGYKPYVGTPEPEPDDKPNAPVKAIVKKPKAKDDGKPSVYRMKINYLLENKHTDEEITKMVMKEKKVTEDKVRVPQTRARINSGGLDIPEAKKKLLPLHRWTRDAKGKLVEYTRTKLERKPKGKAILKKAIGSLPKG